MALMQYLVYHIKFFANTQKSYWYSNCRSYTSMMSIDFICDLECLEWTIHVNRQFVQRAFVYIMYFWKYVILHMDIENKGTTH